MALLSAFLLGLATNLDNLAIGAMLAGQGKRLSWVGNFIIAAGSALAAWLMCRLSGLFNASADWVSLLGGLLLIMIGLLPLLLAAYRSLRKLEQAEEETDRPELDLCHTLLLSAALALNCLPVGIAAGMLGLPAWLLAVSVGLFSLFSVRLGCSLGRALLGVISQQKLAWLASAVLIVLGVAELIS